MCIDSSPGNLHDVNATLFEECSSLLGESIEVGKNIDGPMLQNLEIAAYAAISK